MKLKQTYISFGLCLVIYNTTALADHPTVAFASEGVGAINTIAANTLPDGLWAFGVRSEIINNDAYTTSQLESFAESGLEGIHSVDRIISTSLSLAYGVTNNFSIAVRLPYIQRSNIRESEIEDGDAEAHTHGDSSGIGDLLLLGQHKILTYKDTNVSVLLGLKAPVGETSETDDDGVRFETEFQPGTGSWDFLLGAAVSKNIGNIGYHANILYNKTTEGSQSTEIGDALSYNAAFTYGFGESHASHDHEHHNEGEDSGFQWGLSVELNGETRRKSTVSGVTEENSGGTTVYFAPGVRVSSGDFGGFISYGIPVVEDQNGEQTDTDSRIVAGISLVI